MEQSLAVIVGLVVGTALAVAVALPLRRRLRRSGHSDARARRLALASPEARHRAAVVSAVFAGVATVAALAGQPAWAGIMTMGVVVLGVQSVTGLVAARVGPSHRD